MIDKVRQMLQTYKATGWHKKTYKYSSWIWLIAAGLLFLFSKATRPTGLDEYLLLWVGGAFLTLLVWAYIQAFSYLVWRTAQRSRGFKRIAILLYPSSLIFSIAYFWPDSRWNFFEALVAAILLVALSMLLVMLLFNVMIWVLEGFHQPRNSDY